MSARLLITGGDEIGVLGAIRGLHAAGYQVFAQARSGGSYSARSRACAGTVITPDPHADPDGFAGELANACERLSVSALLPGTEAALQALAPRKERFPDRVSLGVPDPVVVERATSKQALVEIAAQVGIEMPPTRRLEIAALVHRQARELELPLVVKPLRSDTALPGGALRHEAPRLVHSLHELRDAVSATASGEVLLQPYLPGEIYGVCGVAWEGKAVCALHQIGRRIWPPDCGMVSYVETVPRDGDLEARVQALVEAVGWSGIFQLQLLRHRGALYAIDLNPRVYISISLATAAGMNLPAVWAALLLGQTPPLSDYTTGIRWRSEPDDPRSILAGFRDGCRARTLAAALPRRRTTHAVFSWRDPAPVVTTLKRIKEHGKR
jgi:predicted ATP-grasp superfamily ATP-dependent carboligase